jgi:hypothetical protein
LFLLHLIAVSVQSIIGATAKTGAIEVPAFLPRLQPSVCAVSFMSRQLSFDPFLPRFALCHCYIAANGPGLVANSRAQSSSEREIVNITDRRKQIDPDDWMYCSFAINTVDCILWPKSGSSRRLQLDILLQISQL